MNQHLPERLFEATKREVHEASRAPWRISPEAYWLSAEQVRELRRLGHDLLDFYRASNALYLASARGRLAPWVAEYLDWGKPDYVVELARHPRFQRDLPRVIRPDLFYDDAGALHATELDSVPGGIGLTGALMAAYRPLGNHLAGDPPGLVRGFWEMVRDEARALAGNGNRSSRADATPSDPVVAICVSEESNDYWPEMRWLAETLQQAGHPVYAVRPEQLVLDDEGLWLNRDAETRRRGDAETSEASSPCRRVAVSPCRPQHPAPSTRRVDVLYRFFELFDLKSVSKWELLLYAAQRGQICMTPPPKAHLEEKALFALLHHPQLHSFWREELGQRTYDRLLAMFPRTWILDARPLPPQAVLPGLAVNGTPVREWQELERLGQKTRRYVVKASGFSPLSWGSKGVRIGFDLSGQEWAEALQEGLRSFERGGPLYLLQEYQAPRKDRLYYLDFVAGQVREVRARSRISPYYYVIGDRAQLAGVLVTACPLDKLLVHGMTDAIMVPAGVLPEEREPRPGS